MSAVITAKRLASSLTVTFVDVVVPGAERPIAGMELIEPTSSVAVDPADLILAIGAHDVHESLELVERARECAGLVLRRPLAVSPQVLERCTDLGLPLLAVPEEVGWSAVIRLLRAALDRAISDGSPSGRTDHVYSDLFDIADTISAIVEAPVTVEDAQSRVLAYSTGQQDVDDARMSTIVGRQVPREVRDHFRALGVFRRLARSDEPFFVPTERPDVKPRFIIPVRAGGEWLGSVWAVVDEPVADTRTRELRAATEVIALYLLRLRAQSQLHRQVQLDQIRTVLRGGVSEPPGSLEPGPWRVAALAGPDDLEAVEARCELWLALTRRFGWRQPLVADLDGTVYAVLRAQGTDPGTWDWLSGIVRDESRSDAALRCAAGGPAQTLAELAESRIQATEIARLQVTELSGPVDSIETSWAAVVLARAVDSLGATSLVSPVVQLLEHDQRHGGSLVATLEAVLDHWGEPQRAARALAVHPNTIRYRMARLADCCSLDLHDPGQRLAVRLEIARVRADPKHLVRDAGDRGRPDH